MENKIKLFGKEEFKNLQMAAEESGRRRANVNFHETFEDSFQRLVIAMKSDSYVIPHKHSFPAKPESFLTLSGSIGLLIYNQSGDITDTVRLGPSELNQICDIPAGIYHFVVALTDTALFYEGKPGPYTPIDPRDIAPWAPAPNTSESEQLVEFAKGLFLN